MLTRAAPPPAASAEVRRQFAQQRRARLARIAAECLAGFIAGVVLVLWLLGGSG